MDQWEYLTTFCYADIENPGVRELLAQRLSDPEPPKYAVQALMPELNAYGLEGWELVHMQPVAQVGSKGDVSFCYSGIAWSHAYFCVFKRRAQPTKA